MVDFHFKEKRREKLRQRPLSAEQRATVRRNVPGAASLSAEDQRELEGHVQVFLAEKTFEGCGGLVMTDEIKLTIAAQACILLLHRETDGYPGLDSISVYPSAYVAKNKRQKFDEPVVASDSVRPGEVSARGAVVLTWDAVERGASNFEVLRELYRQDPSAGRRRRQKRPLSATDFEILIEPLIGMKVSRASKSYGTMIHLELGRLRPPKGKDRTYGAGEATISISWDWRVEDAAAVLYGSSEQGFVIRDGVDGLTGAVIESISISGPIPELVIRFSNGQRLLSMVMAARDPQWDIRLSKTAWILPEAGGLWLGDDGALGLSDEEAAASAFEEATALRWGSPRAEPAPGSCADCQSFFALAAETFMLDFGVCTDSKSPFDGRVVRCTSGCPMFR